MKKLMLLSGISAFVALAGCNYTPTSNDLQRDRQEQSLQQAVAQTGVPSLTHFREMKILKSIYEMRDQDGLVTYTYLYSPMLGKFTFLCDSIGYGIPYSTQITAGESVQRYYLPGTSDRSAQWGWEKLPQAEPNGLFVPSSAAGTWVLCQVPGTK